MGQFDVLGLVSPYLIQLKFIMRDLTTEDSKKIGWDEEIPNAVKIKFVEALKNIKDVGELKFPRCVEPDFVDRSQGPELLIFGDGSTQAFCALVYVRWKLTNGSFKCCFITGKTRVAPLRKITVPRIELMGSVMAVRLCETVLKFTKLKIAKRHFFTDSTAVHGMINMSCGAFNEFVGTRVGEIKAKSESQEWSWLPTHENLADLGTRDNVKPDMLALGSKYQVGMDWMNQEEETWPVKKNPGNSAKEIEGELTSAAKKVLTVNSTEIELNLINNLKKYCSYMRAQRVTATFFMAVERFRLKQRNRDNEKNGLEPL